MEATRNYGRLSRAAIAACLARHLAAPSAPVGKGLFSFLPPAGGKEKESGAQGKSYKRWWMLRGLAGVDSAGGARRGERVARSRGRAGESVRGEARQLPHVMILPQVSDDVPRHYHYHPVNRTTAENREYTLK